MSQKIRYFDQSIQVPEQWLEAFQSSPGILYHQGDLIYRQEEKAHHFYYLKRGKVQAFVTSLDGTEKKLTEYASGDVFGEASFFDGFPRISSARALQDSVIIPIGHDEVLALFQDHPNFAFTLMTHLSRKVRMLSREIDHLAFLPAEKRIAQFLLNQVEGSKRFYEGTQEDIGQAVGVRRVTVSRALRSFAQQRWISIQYRKIHVLNPDALRTYFDES